VSLSVIAPTAFGDKDSFLATSPFDTRSAYSPLLGGSSVDNVVLSDRITIGFGAVEEPGGEMADLKTKKGTKLSKGTVDDLAREAGAGYDLATAKRQRVGRPSLAEGDSPRVSYRVAPALLNSAKKKAKAEGRTVSEVAREALEKYVAS
jgi:hypothetical protein